MLYVMHVTKISYLEALSLAENKLSFCPKTSAKLPSISEKTHFPYVSVSVYVDIDGV